jgi:hypothetical protein
MNPIRSRLWRTIILFLAGLGLSFLVAMIFAPYWPGFCDETIVGAPCGTVAMQTMAGYLQIALGILTVIFGPIAGSMLDLLINGAKWETPRGSESIITNMPILVGAIYVVVGVVVVATA